MAVKKFTKHAQRVLNHNPNVVRCTEAKIVFTEEFAQKVCDALKAGEDPYLVFEENGISIRVLGKPRVTGTIGLWKSKYELTDLPKRKRVSKEKKETLSAAEKKQKNLEAAIAYCDALIAKPDELGLTSEETLDTIRFAAIKKTYDSKLPVVVKDLCAHYGYPYSKYYGYLNSLKPKEEFYNPLNPHNKN